MRTEVYNLNWRLIKKVEECLKLDEQTVLYIERGDTKEKPENFKWHRKFNEEFEKLYIQVMLDEEKKTIESKKSNTLVDMKQEISKLWSIPMDELVVKKGLCELKGGDKKLMDLGLIEGDILKIERGKPHQEGVVEINVYVVTLS